MKVKRNKKRTEAWLLTAAMVFSLLGPSAYAVVGAGNRKINQDTGLCKHHSEHNAECGYGETASPSNAGESCTYICDICLETEECICEDACSDGLVDGDCPLCGSEDIGWQACRLADLTEKEKSDTFVVTDWEWVDEEHYIQGDVITLSEDTGNVTLEDILEVLPTEINAQVSMASDADEILVLSAEDVLEETLQVENWSCKKYPKDGASAGNYRFTADLPEGYVLANGAESLTIMMTIGGEQLASGSNAARIDTTQYDTLGEAFRHAQPNDIIVLQTNVMENNRIGKLESTSSVSSAWMDEELVPIADNVTLDLNGKILAGKGETSANYPLGLYHVTGFTITDKVGDGCIQAGDGDYAVYAEDSSLVVESGVFRGGRRALELTRSECTIEDGIFEAKDYTIYAGRESGLEINGGIFTSTGSGDDCAALFVTLYSESISLSGGTYKGVNAGVRVAGNKTIGSILSKGKGYYDKNDAPVSNTGVRASAEEVTVGDSEIKPDPGSVYTITFDANGGSVSPLSAETDTEGQLSVLPVPVRNGNYRFDGWFTAAKGGTQVNIDYVYTADTTIYAHWGNTNSNNNGNGSSSSGSSGGSSRTILTSVPAGYTGGTIIINNIRVPDYTIQGQWSKNETGQWNLRSSDGRLFANTWVAAFNPYADVKGGQSAFDWFRFDAEGNMITGWYTDEVGNTYYLNPVSNNTLGAMATGWRLIDGSYYYFNDKPDGTRGKLLRDTKTPDGYYVDEKGGWDR